MRYGSENENGNSMEETLIRMLSPRRTGTSSLLITSVLLQSEWGQRLEYGSYCSIAKSCSTQFWDPMHCVACQAPPSMGFSQPRILEWEQSLKYCKQEQWLEYSRHPINMWENERREEKKGGLWRKGGERKGDKNFFYMSVYKVITHWEFLLPDFSNFLNVHLILLRFQFLHLILPPSIMCVFFSITIK